MGRKLKHLLRDGLVGAGLLEPGDRFSIALYEGSSPTALAPRGGQAVPVLTRRSVHDVRAEYVADPFMLRADGAWHLLFEVLNADTGRGEIGLAVSPDARSWSYRGIVLTEPFHLSYPYLFEEQGERYLMPESHQAGSVRLYRADPFPLRWTLHATLLRGLPFADPSIVRHDGAWYLFTETAPDGACTTLRLYRAEELTGPWAEHPASPIVADDPGRARPAGRITATDDGLIRYAQDCRTRYGGAVRAFRILELSPTAYRERELSGSPVLTASGAGWNGLGMHHVDPHRLEDGRWLACVDGLSARTLRFPVRGKAAA